MKKLVTTLLLALFSTVYAAPIDFDSMNIASSAYGMVGYESVPRLMEAFNGKIYFILSEDGTDTPSKVYCYDPADGLSDSVNHTILAETTGRFMVIRKAGNLLYFADDLGNLYSYNGTVLTEMTGTPFAAANYVSSVESYMGDVYFGTWSSKIYRYVGGNYELVYSVSEDRSRINDMVAWQKDGYIYASVGHINTCCPPTGYVIRSNNGNPGSWQTVFQGFWDTSLFIQTPNYLYTAVIDTAYGYGSTVRRSMDGLSFPAIDQSTGQYKMIWGSFYYNEIAYFFTNQWAGGNGYRIIDDNGDISRIQNKNWTLTQSVELNGEVYALCSFSPHEYNGGLVPADIYLLTTASSSSNSNYIVDCFTPGIEMRSGDRRIIGLALSPDESELYAAYWTDTSADPLGVYSTSDCPLSLSETMSYGRCHGGVAVSSDGRYLYTPSYYEGNVSRFDLLNGNSRTSLAAGSWPAGINISPDGTKLVVLSGRDGGSYDMNNDAVYIYDITGNNFSLLRAVSLNDEPQGTRPIFSSDSQHVYVSTYKRKSLQARLYEISINTGNTRSLGFPDATTRLSSITRNDQYLFISDTDNSKIWFVNPINWCVEDHIDLDFVPNAVSMHPDNRHLFVTPWQSSFPGTFVGICDVVTKKVGPIVDLGHYNPADIVFTQDGKKAFIGHYHGTDGGITVLNISFSGSVIPQDDIEDIAFPDLGSSKLLLWNAEDKRFDNIEDVSVYYPERDAVIISHGWNSHGDKKWVQEMAQYLSKEHSDNVNVFSWDWETEAKSVFPPTNKVPHQSELLADVLQNSIVPNIRSAGSIRMIGHSLGAALVTRTAKILELESEGINVDRVSLLDPPENWASYAYGWSAVKIKGFVKELSENGVLVDNYPTQFGENYDYASNFDLRDAADATGTSSNPITDHSFSHYWYNGSIEPYEDQMPDQSIRKEVKMLYNYYDWIDEASVFWSGVWDVGSNLTNYQLSTYKPLLHTAPNTRLDYYPFIFEQFNQSVIWDSTYNLLTIDTFDVSGSWKVDGTANIQSGQMNIYTNSPSYLFQVVTIPENASVIRFDYQFLSDSEGDMLYLYADEELLWLMSSTPHNMNNIVNTGWMDIAHLAGRTVRLCFALNNTTEAQAHAVIDDLEIAEEIGPENATPIANAGSDNVFSANSAGFAEVILDGSGSFDPDGDELFYIWVLGDTVIANGVMPTVSLTIGVHSIQLTVRDLFTDSEPDEVEIVVVDDTGPVVQIITPTVDAAVQDSITLTAGVEDMSEILLTFFKIREVSSTDPNGTDVGFENLVAAYNDATGQWTRSFDSTQLPDGYYQITAIAVDEYGNVGTSEVVPFSIRNWAVVELLPSSDEYRARRTMPIKFSLRISEAVDPAMPFVYNEQLRVDIYQTSNPSTILQSSLFGDTDTDYRIDMDGEKYITNFKTDRNPAEYTVDIWRTVNDFFVHSFTFETESPRGRSRRR